jgi:hypothetical protein
MYLVAWGVTGFGDWICETESGRPLGMSTVKLKLSRRDSRRELDEECFSFEDEEWCLDERFSLSDEECLEEELVFEERWDEDEDFSWGTSRMFKTRPVVGSVVDDCPGSWETWYPSMM